MSPTVVPQDKFSFLLLLLCWGLNWGPQAC
jgi:hypothetical protein